MPLDNTLTANSNVTVHGDLSGADAYFTFYGATLTNTGSSISVDNVYFYGTGANHHRRRVVDGDGHVLR